MTCSNLVTCEVIRLVRNCASTCANHNSGSAGQNVGSLRETVARVGSETGGGDPWRDITEVRGVRVTNVKSEDLNRIYFIIKILRGTKIGGDTEEREKEDKRQSLDS